MRKMTLTKSNSKSIAEHKNANIADITEAFSFYNNILKPVIAPFYAQNKDGMHGLNTHIKSVVFRGIDYALHMGAEPVPVIFACAFHDMARTSDEFDLNHGTHAIPAAIKVMKQFPGLLNQDTRLSILHAIANHTGGMVAPDYISACLWDADRTRLAWSYGFEDSFFNTQRGKYVAQHYGQYLEYQKKFFPKFDWSRQY